MHTSTDRKSIQVKRSDIRLAVSILIPRSEFGNREEARSARDNCLAQLPDVLRNALSAYGRKIEVVKKRGGDAITLDELAHLKVSHGERTNKDDRDMVIFYVPTPAKLVKGGRGSISESLEEVARRVALRVKEYWDGFITEAVPA